MIKKQDFKHLKLLSFGSEVQKISGLTQNGFKHFIETSFDSFNSLRIEYMKTKML